MCGRCRNERQGMHVTVVVLHCIPASFKFPRENELFRACVIVCNRGRDDGRRRGCAASCAASVGGVPGAASGKYSAFVCQRGCQQTEPPQQHSRSNLHFLRFPVHVTAGTQHRCHLAAEDCITSEGNTALRTAPPRLLPTEPDPS